MKRTRVVAALALAFALGISISFVNCNSEPEVSASSEITTIEATDVETVVVSNEADFLQALKDENIKHITINADLNLTTSGILRHSVTIDLNGHTIRCDGGVPLAVFQGSDVKIIGSGMINGSGRGNGLEVYGATESVANYSVVSVGKDVVIKSDNMYGLSILPNSSSSNPKTSYGVVVNFAGKIDAPYGVSIHGGITHAENCPQINFLDGSEITSVTEADATPIYAAGRGIWKIGAAKLTGKTGIGIRSGNLTFNGTEVTIDGEMREPNTGSGGIDGIGAVFQIEHHKAYADQIVLNINSGKYTSVNGDVFYEYGNIETGDNKVADINIAGGEFIAAPEHNVFGGSLEDSDIVITSGKFSGTDVADFEKNGYLAEGVVLGEDGVVATPAPEPVYPRPSYSPAVSGTYQSADGIITVSGKFSTAVADVRVKHLDKFMSIFNGSDYALYDIELFDAAGKPVEARGEITVSIAVPTKWSDREISVFYVGENNNLEKHTATYADGKVTFTTTHFSVYAVVSDGGKTVPDSVYQPGHLDETGSKPSEGNTNNSNNDNNVSTPETGINHHTSAGDAVVTALPILTAAGLIFIVFSRKIFKHQAHNYRTADVEQEIDTQIKEFVSPEPEEDNERFLATPMTQMDAEEIRASVLKSSQK